ncbi:hypothetical protein ACP4OV_008879 [Aristida adscensionis]
MMLRELVESGKSIAAQFEEFQAWLRAEMKEKGYVEVDESYVANRVVLHQMMEKA